MSPEVIIDGREALASLFVGRFESAARSAIEAHGRVACARPRGSGGSTVLPKLARA